MLDADLRVCLSHQIWPLWSKRYGRGTPGNMARAAKLMCTKNSGLKDNLLT